MAFWNLRPLVLSESRVGGYRDLSGSRVRGFAGSGFWFWFSGSRVKIPATRLNA